MDITQLIKDLGKAIQQDERCIKYNEVKEANDNDQELQGLMEKFEEKKAELNSFLSDPNKDKERLSELDKELKEVYEAIINNKNMILYNEVKEEVDQLMSYINRVIIGCFNGQNADDIPFTEVESACSGSCSSCGGCH